MCLQLADPDDRAAGVQDGVAGPGICGSWIFASGRAMSVIIEVGIGVHLKSLPAFRVQRDSLRPCGLEVIDQVAYRIPMRIPCILVEAGALMRCIGDVGPSAILKEVDISHNFSLIEALVKRRGGSIST